MKSRYRLIHRGNRIASFYLVDTRTGKPTSLHTADKDAAKQIVEAKNQAERQPLLNLRSPRRICLAPTTESRLALGGTASKPSRK